MCIFQQAASHHDHEQTFWKVGENTNKIFQDIMCTMFGMHGQTDAWMHEQPENIMPPAALYWQRHKKTLQLKRGAKIRSFWNISNSIIHNFKEISQLSMLSQQHCLTAQVQCLFIMLCHYNIRIIKQYHRKQLKSICQICQIQLVYSLQPTTHFLRSSIWQTTEYL